MSFNTDDTICAVASAPGGAGRGIVRVSGPAAVSIGEKLCGFNDRLAISEVHKPSVKNCDVAICMGTVSRNLPCQMLIWPTNRSYTREPIVEFHLLGSPPLLERLVAAVCQAGARLAEPGEFTLRAFLAGRLDLTQAEAVLGVIDARRSDDLDTALSQLAGGLSYPLDQLQDELLQLLAELEAGLDFVDEDIEFISPNELYKRLQTAAQLMDDVIEQMASRHSARASQHIVLLGPPNAGKSSLFNEMVSRFGSEDTMLGYPAPVPALVSQQRGTTRDYLTAALSLGGIPCHLVDTAGIDEVAAPEIEASAQSLALRQLESASIYALCVEAAEWTDASDLRTLISKFGERRCDLVILTKADDSRVSAISLHELSNRPVVLTSSRTGQGLNELARKLETLLSTSELVQRNRVVASTAVRCRESVRLAQASLSRAVELVQMSGGHELIAAELRAALNEIGRVVGAIYTNDLLDRIFGTFCIGK